MAETLTKQVDDYCNCLQSKNVDECQPLYLTLLNTYDSLTYKLDFAYVAMQIDTKDFDRLTLEARTLFDKKAKCAQEAMLKEEVK